MAMPLGKAELRRSMDAARRAMSAEEHRMRSEAICRHLAAYVGLPDEYAAASNARTIMAYMPFRAEADIVPFLLQLWKTRSRVLLPRTETASGTMSFHYTASPEELVPGKWGILEPPAHLPAWDGAEPIDLVLVPGLAFDRQGGRLGYGGGYYDRFFAALAANLRERNRPMPERVAPAFGFQVVPEVPMEAGDWPVNGIITEDGWIPCGERPAASE